MPGVERIRQSRSESVHHVQRASILLPCADGHNEAASRTVLRHIRVNSKEELRERIEQYLEELNEHPVPFRWRYGLQGVRE